MNEMLQPGQRCDFTCWCKYELARFETYAIWNQPSGWIKGAGGGRTLTICEHCAKEIIPNRWFTSSMTPPIFFRVDDGSPVHPPTTPDHE